MSEKNRRLRIIRYCITVTHCILTVVWSPRVFKNIGIIPTGTVALNGIVSDGFERVMAYICTELIAIVFVILLWRLLFHLVEDFKSSYIPFLVIFAVGTVVLALCWPYVFEISEDNYITYACAVRLVPDYWHSAYSSFVYGACMLLFPIDFMIPLIQWVFFVFAVSYLFHRLKNVAGNLKYSAFLLFLLPNSFRIIRDCYRIYQYLIAALIFATVLLFDIIEKKERTTREMVKLVIFAAFLAVWRNEGIIWATALFFIYVVISKRDALKKKLILLGAFVLSFLVINAPQKIGLTKYYGNDYQIVNTMSRLQTMFNIEELNLEYKGAEEDLKAIDAVVERKYIREYGLISYLSFNVGVRGLTDIDQSGVSGEVSDRFMKAYYNIILHNKLLFTKTVFDGLSRIYTGKYVFYPFRFTGEHSEAPAWSFAAWDIGKNDLLSNYHTYVWNRETSRINIAPKLIDAWNRYDSDFESKGGLLISTLTMAICMVASFAAGIVIYVRKKNKTKLSLGLFGLVLMGEFAALLLVMPVYAYVYLLITTYLSLLFVIALVAELIKGRQDAKLQEKPL